MSAPSRRAVLAAPLTAAALLAAAASPDAELVSLCEQHVANLRVMYAMPILGDEPEPHPVWQTHSRTMRAISDARPRTMTGVLAKAHAAICDGAVDELLDGEHDSFGFNAHAGAWDLLQDLARIHSLEAKDPRTGAAI